MFEHELDLVYAVIELANARAEAGGYETERFQFPSKLNLFMMRYLHALFYPWLLSNRHSRQNVSSARTNKGITLTQQGVSILTTKQV